MTSEAGAYTLTLLPIGRCTLSITLQGFGTFNRNVQMSAGDRVRVDAQLAVGALSETISVTAEAPIMQSASATVGARAVHGPQLDGAEQHRRHWGPTEPDLLG